MLDELGLKYDTDKSSKAHDYLHLYERIIKRDKVKSLLEIGVFQGASLKMWRDWLPDAKIVGMDINPVEPIEGCEIVRGDQNKLEDLAIVARRYGPFDIIIDDGSHIEYAQRISFEFLGYFCKQFYFIEDIKTEQEWPLWVRIPSRHPVGGLELAVYRA